MIVRKLADGTMVMISQTEHCRLSGVLAAHWGNGAFSRPVPFESVIRAATFHDCAWYKYDVVPLWDPTTGSTPNFMQVPLDKKQLDIFQWGSDWLTEIDPYAGLLISRHRTGLWKGRYGRMRHPVAFNAKNLNEQVSAFISGNEAAQAQQIKTYKRDEFETNYVLLQVWDFFSLYFCTDEPKEDRIEPVPQAYGDGAVAANMVLTPLQGDRIRISPYPFDVHPFPISLTYRQLPAHTFASEQAFLQAYYGAIQQIRNWTLVS